MGRSFGELEFYIGGSITTEVANELIAVINELGLDSMHLSDRYDTGCFIKVADLKDQHKLGVSGVLELFTTECYEGDEYKLIDFCKENGLPFKYFRPTYEDGQGDAFWAWWSPGDGDDLKYIQASNLDQDLLFVPHDLMMNVYRALNKIVQEAYNDEDLTGLYIGEKVDSVLKDMNILLVEPPDLPKLEVIE